MGRTDEIGNRGENICMVRLSESLGGAGPLFRSHHLGEKCPVLDLMVEAIAAGKQTPFFFLQIKSTRLGYTRTPPVRLKVGISKKNAGLLIAYPAPTYFVGVDEEQELAYIVAANGRIKEGFASLPTQYPLDATHLPILWDEVRGFWQARKMTMPKSAFSL